MRRSFITELATLPTAVAVAMGIVDLITGFARVLPQLHGFIDVLFALSGVFAMKKHKPGDEGAAAEPGYDADYQRTLRSFGDAAEQAMSRPQGGATQSA